MCGITGLLTFPNQDAAELERCVTRMASTMRRRGPDDQGCWLDAQAGIAFGHQRLAIIDLSPAGHQPMVSQCGRFVLSFNGEIYNFKELRAELCGLGYTFRGQSDTEVILGAISGWGLEPAIQRLDGMFAFGLWDRNQRQLHLVRDRIGEKPLYYGWSPLGLSFSSDLRAVEVQPGFTREIEPQALHLYFRYAYVPAPHSIYRGIFKLPPGCSITFEEQHWQRPPEFSPWPDDEAPSARLKPVRYWSAWDVALRGLESPFEGSDEDAVEQLDALISRAVRNRMIADVPLGALLSGGIDSSTVAALMQVHSTVPVRTFTIGFDDKRFDEADDARAVARHLGTDHTELSLKPRDALDIIERLPEIYDEPFADASQIPTSLLSVLVRQHVTVGLSGDGGDELFGGYRRYPMGESIWRKVSWLPLSVRSAAAKMLLSLETTQWDRVAGWMSLPGNYGTHGTAGDKFHKLADVLLMRTPDDLYERLVSVWAKPSEIVHNAAHDTAPQHGVAKRFRSKDVPTRMMLFDLLGYLPDDILTKVDRASMAASLEIRVPLLDHRIVEFAWHLPRAMKLKDGQAKRPLVRVLQRYVPADLVNKPKRGFGMPVASWLRGPLRDWGQSLLTSAALESAGLRPQPILQQWKEHQQGVRDWQGTLWSVLMFQNWNMTHRRS